MRSQVVTGDERLGLELNDFNEILSLVPGTPAAESSALRKQDRIVMVDGEALVEALPVAPWVDCAAVARHLINTRLRLTDARRSTFGLFFADNGRPLNRSEFVGDVQESAFVFKRVLRFSGTGYLLPYEA